jgi:hypothetical protein
VSGSGSTPCGRTAPGIAVGDRVQDGNEVRPGRRGHRDHARAALDIVRACSLVPQQPPPLRGPPDGFVRQVTSIRTHEQVRLDQSVEGAADAFPGAAIVGHQDPRNKAHVAHRDAPQADGVLHGLPEAGGRHTPEGPIAAGQRQRRGEQERPL